MSGYCAHLFARKCLFLSIEGLLVQYVLCFRLPHVCMHVNMYVCVCTHLSLLRTYVLPFTVQHVCACLSLLISNESIRAVLQAATSMWMCVCFYEEMCVCVCLFCQPLFNTSCACVYICLCMWHKLTFLRASISPLRWSSCKKAASLSLSRASFWCSHCICGFCVVCMHVHT